MAEQEENSMIGYDPLAWMHEAEEVESPTRSAPLSAALPDDSAIFDDMADAGVETEPGAALNAADLQPSADTETTGRIILEPLQNIQTVSQLHQQLRCMLDSCNKIDIDASAVSQIDTATLQLLLVLKLTAVKLRKEVNIDFPSEKFMEAADLLGVSGMLSVDRAVSGFF